MAGYSVPIDFWVEPSKITNSAERSKVLYGLQQLLEGLSGSLKQMSNINLPGDNYLTVYGSETMSASVKQYKEGLVSAVLEYFICDGTNDTDSLKISLEDIHNLEDKIRLKFSSLRTKVLPALKRAPKINPYLTSSDDRILEYDIDGIVFEEKTDFQKVQIVHTKSFGNMLVLDDLQNLAESDLPYTRGLMNFGIDTYEGKEILILGGGDGALLYELLKENPKFITMIDIDEAVVVSCRKYMRSVCQDVMDKYEGDNYKIIIDDAIVYMKQYLKAGKEFDYVFGDLTDVPISKVARGEHWDFMRLILNLGTKLLKTGTGKYMTHAIGETCISALNMFESQIELLETPNTFTKTSHYVPSFKEKWCFYQITKKGV